MILLEDEADVFFVQFDAATIIELMDRIFEKVIFPFPGAIQHPDDAHQRGLARARWAHDGYEVALGNIEIDPAEHPRLPRTGLVGFFHIH